MNVPSTALATTSVAIQSASSRLAKPAPKITQGKSNNATHQADGEMSGHPMPSAGGHARGAG